MSLNGRNLTTYHFYHEGSVAVEILEVPLRSLDPVELRGKIASTPEVYFILNRGNNSAAVRFDSAVTSRAWRTDLKWFGCSAAKLVPNTDGMSYRLRCFGEKNRRGLLNDEIKLHLRGAGVCLVE